MNDRPSLHELRLRVFKHSGSPLPEIGNVLARRIGRPSAIYGTWLAVRFGISANAITSLSLIAGLAGAAMIGSGSRTAFIAGVIGLIVSYWLDHVDGQVARWRGTASLSGVYFDYLLHYALNLAVGFAIGFGLTMRGELLLWTLCGFVIAASWTLLNLHNDCRYKAFFQRLKQPNEIHRVEGGSGVRPSPPTSWPMRWPGIVTWPMGKMCEFHVVLIWLTGLMVAAFVSPAIWLISWKMSVMILAAASPVLAAGRAARSVMRGEADAEFSRWFLPDSIEENSRPQRAPVARREGAASCPRSVT